MSKYVNIPRPSSTEVRYITGHILYGGGTFISRYTQRLSRLGGCLGIRKCALFGVKSVVWPIIFHEHPTSFTC